MSGTYDLIYRQVALKANLIDSVSATTMTSSYELSSIGTTELGERAAVFPNKSIEDAILNAGGQVVSVIGHNYKSPYRNYFAAVTGNVTNGGLIGPQSSGSKDIVGIIGEVRDSSSAARMQFKSYQEILSVRNVTLKYTPYWYFTDNVRIWHTVTNVVADVVIWHRSDQATLVAARGACPFPSDLYPVIVAGAVSDLGRQSFNLEQSSMWAQKFTAYLEVLSNGSERIQLADKEAE